MTDTLTERAAMLEAIRGRTLTSLLARNATDYGQAPALSWRVEDDWTTLTWSEYHEVVLDVAAALIKRGVQKGQRVAVMAGNRPEHVIADLAAVTAGAVPVSIYPTLAPEQTTFIASDADVVLAFVDGERRPAWDLIRDRLPRLTAVIDLDDEGEHSWSALVAAGQAARRDDPAPLDERIAASDSDDIATVIYTSGTTGNPKGVVLTTANLMFELEALDRVTSFPEGYVNVSYLPLAHIAERLFSHYIGLLHHGHTSFCSEQFLLLPTLVAARPEAFLGVPRVWEKLKAGIEAKIAAEPDDARRLGAQQAIAFAIEMVQRAQKGEIIGSDERAQLDTLEQAVFATIRGALGLDRTTICYSGAAPLPVDVHEFMAAVGLPVIEVYGMTETVGVTNANRPGRQRYGTVGPALPGVEVTLADDGEVLARGPNVMPGYLGRDDLTGEAIDRDGWMHTGDLGAFDDDGSLRIVGRKKELIITAGGKNIAPVAIESLVKQHSLIGQVCAIGDRRPYLTALIVLDPEVAPAWAARHGINQTAVALLSQNPKIVAEVQKAVDTANAQVAPVEQIKRFTILPMEWSPAGGELTPTLKLRRAVVHDKYASEIDGMY